MLFRSCADTLSRAFEDMTDEDRREFMPMLSDEKEDFILSVRDDSGDVSLSLNPSSETPDYEYSGWTSYLLNSDPQDGQEGMTDETDKFEASRFGCYNTNQCCCTCTR